MKDPSHKTSKSGGSAETIAITPRLFLHHPTRRAAHTYKGTVLFADISGFTTLAERLAEKGEEGCEALNSLLSSYFSLLIAAIDRQGGYLLNLAGDALNVLFHDEQPQATPSERRAVLCAMEIQSVTASFESNVPLIGTIRLSIKLAVAPGEVTTSVAGCPVIGENFLTYGNGLEAAAGVEKYTNPGQLCIDQKLAEGIPGLETTPVRDEIVEVTGLQGSRETHWTYPPARATVEEMQPQIPPKVWQYLNRGAGNYLNSIRPVTAMFIGFSDFDALGEGRHQALVDYFQVAQRIIDRHGGLLIEFDAGDKGNKFIGIFGAPNAVGHKENRAIESAMALRTASKNLKHISSLKIGIATGHLFSGLIGGSGQLRYSLMGDKMNLSARLMSLAKPFQILLDGATFQRATGSFNFGPPCPTTVKGKTEKITVRSIEGYITQRPQHDERRGTGVVGRDLELQQLRARYEKALGGQGQVVLLEGDAGVGKSRILAPLLVQLSTLKERQLLQGQCTDYSQGTAYHPWCSALLQILNLKSQKLTSESILNAIKALQPKHLQIAPLLFPVLGVEAPLPQFLTTLEARPRQKLTEDLIISLIAGSLSEHSGVLFIDNLQWIDSSSASLLAQLILQTHSLPLLLLLTKRPTEEDDADPIKQALSKAPTVTSLKLGPLNQEDCRLIAATRLGATSLDPQLAELVFNRSGGNPLLVEELCDLLQQRQHVNLLRGYARLALQSHQIVVPDSATGMVLARVEQLDPDVQMCLQAASVLGSQFRLDDLEAIYKRESEISPRDAVALAHKFDIVRISREADVSTYFFKHSMAQEAIYTTLSFSLRRELHERIARHLEQRLEETQQSSLILLIAEHYHRTERDEQLLKYGVMAGEISLKSHLYDGATNWFLLTSDIHKKHHSTLGQAECIAMAHNTTRLAGNLDSEGQVLSRWAEIEDLDQHTSLFATMLTAKVLYLHRRGKSDEALQTAESASQLLKQQKDGANGARLHIQECSILMETRQFDKAEEALSKAEQSAKDVEDLGLHAKLHSQKAALCLRRGKLKTAMPLLQTSLKLYRQAKDTSGEAYVLGNLSLVYQSLQDFEEATRLASGAAELSNVLGSLRHEARHRYNTAFAQLSLGMLEECHTELQTSLELSQRCDWRLGELQALLLSAATELFQGNPKETKACISQIHRMDMALPKDVQAALLWLTSESLLALEDIQSCLETVQELETLANAQKKASWMDYHCLEVKAQAHLQQGNFAKVAELNQKMREEWLTISRGLPYPGRSIIRRWDSERQTKELKHAQETLQEAKVLAEQKLSKIKDTKTRQQCRQNTPWLRRLFEHLADQDKDN